MTARRTKAVPRRRRAWALLALLLVLVAAWVGWSPSFRVRTIEVRGARSVAADEVRAAVDLVAGTHLWFGVDPQALARQVLDRLPVLDEAAVSRGFPGRVVVAVAESRPVAWVDTEGGQRAVSSRGIVLAAEPGLNVPQLGLPPLPALTVGQALPLDASPHLAVAVALERLEISDIAAVERDDDQIVWLRTADGMIVKVGLIDPTLPERLAPLPYLLTDARESGYRVEYVDISCPGRPALKTRSEDDDE